MSLCVLILIFSPTVYLQPKITHHTYHNFKDIIRDKNLVLLNGDKDSSVIVMNRLKYYYAKKD